MMKKILYYKYTLGFLIAIMVITVIAVFYVSIKFDGEANRIQQERVPTAKSGFDLLTNIINLDKGNINEKFPYKLYLDSADWYNVNSIRKHIEILDSVNPDNAWASVEILSLALTSKLEEASQAKFSNCNLDTLLQYLQWAEKFRFYSEVGKSEKDNLLFESIGSYWMGFVANKLSQCYKDNNNIKYNYKFRYLSDRCYERKFSATIGNTKLEKILINLSEQNFSYILNRFWYGAGAGLKAIGLIIVVITGFAYYTLILNLIKRFKK